MKAGFPRDPAPPPALSGTSAWAAERAGRAVMRGATAHPAPRPALAGVSASTAASEGAAVRSVEVDAPPHPALASAACRQVGTEEAKAR